MKMVDYEARGIPFGRPAEVSLRNNHAQYIFTWYGFPLAPPFFPYSFLVARCRLGAG
jgi:surfeit locus 1 family protein